MMTKTPESDSEDRGVNWQDGTTLLAVLVALALIVPLLATVGAGPAAAQSTPENVSDVAPYYANESSDVNNESWYEGVDNATLDSMGEMATRFVPQFIGYGQMAPGGAGFEGILLTGIIMTALFIGAVMMLPIGSVGGGVLAVAVGYGMTEMGLAPSWFRVILVFVGAMLVFVAYRQAQQAR